MGRHTTCNFSRAGLSVDEVPQGWGEGCVRDAVFRDDGGDVALGGYVEGDVGGADVWGDGDLGAGGEREIDGGDGGGDVERDVIFFGQDSDAVRADFVGGVTVGGDAVGADYDGPDAAG